MYLSPRLLFTGVQVSNCLNILWYLPLWTTSVYINPPSPNSFNTAVQSKYIFWRSFKRRTKGNFTRIRTRSCKKLWVQTVPCAVFPVAWIKTMCEKLLSSPELKVAPLYVACRPLTRFSVLNSKLFKWLW